MPTGFGNDHLDYEPTLFPLDLSLSTDLFPPHLGALQPSLLLPLDFIIRSTQQVTT